MSEGLVKRLPIKQNIHHKKPNKLLAILVVISAKQD